MTEQRRPPQASALQWLETHRWVSLAFVLPLIVAVYLAAAAVTIRHSNQDPVASDQGAEIWLAATSRDDLLPRRTDGVRHPLWSWIARVVYVDNERVFFQRGKWLNSLFCIGFLCGLGVVVTRWLDPLATANLLLLSSMGILLVRGTYFQPEPLYYVSFFFATVLGWKILQESSWRTYAIFGVVCGIAYLAKPSLAPFLLVFCMVLGIRAVLTVRVPNSQWSIAQAFGGLAMALAIVAVMLVPLAIFSAQHFGKPLFNYTRYWMWMDDFMTEAWPFQDKYPGRVQLEQLPEAETPSPAWYFRRHGIGDAGRRLGVGTREVVSRFLFPETKLPLRAIFWRPAGKKWEQPLAHRGIYLLLLAGLCALLAFLSRAKLLEALQSPGNISCLLYAILVLMLYSLLYGWYWPIGRGDRFMGSLWLPFVFLLVRGASVLRQKGGSRLADRAYLATHTLVLLLLLLQVAGMLLRFSASIYLVTRN